MSERPRRLATWRWLLGLAVGALVIAVLAPFGLREHRLSRQLACIENLQRLATAIKIYAAALPGSPFASSEETIQVMVDAGVVTEAQTVSPHTGRQLVVAFPGGIPSGIDNRAVLVYEPLPEGETGCGCAVFVDGHGECMSPEKHRAAVGRKLDPS